MKINKYRYILKAENNNENEKTIYNFAKLYNKTNKNSKIVIRFSKLNKSKILNCELNNLIKENNFDLLKKLIFNNLNENELCEILNINYNIKIRNNSGSMKKEFCDYLRVYINKKE